MLLVYMQQPQVAILIMFSVLVQCYKCTYVCNTNMYTKVNLSMHHNSHYACMQLLYSALLFHILVKISSYVCIYMKFVVHGTQSSDDILYIQSWFIINKLCMVNIYYDDKRVQRMQLHSYSMYEEFNYCTGTYIKCFLPNLLMTGLGWQYCKVLKCLLISCCTF